GVLPRPALPSASGPVTVTGEPLLLAQSSESSRFSLLQDLQRQKEEIRHLRGKVEMLEHNIERNRQSRKQMYEDLDNRLTALEKGGTKKADEKEIEQAYTAAFQELRNGNYDKAIHGFEAFVDDYPDTSYSDNAWYWLGQARY